MPIRNRLSLDADKQVQRWMGMALLTATQFPEYRQIILSLVNSTTVLFELGGSVLTRVALKRTRYSAPP